MIGIVVGVVPIRTIKN